MVKRETRLLLRSAALALALAAAAACNTVEGAGEDLQAGGEAIEGTAKDAKN